MTIYIKKEGAKPPDEHHYIVATNGFFLHKINPLMDVVMKVQQIPNLLEEQEKAEFNFPKIKIHELYQCIAFFYATYKRFNAESIVLIYWHPKNGYLFHAPEQDVCYESIIYTRNDVFDRYRLVGSIHCHGCLIAYHSKEHEFSDHEDEIDFDGLHITIGNINSNVISISCSVMVNGKRFMLNPLDYLEGIEHFEIKKNIPQSDKIVNEPNTNKLNTFFKLARSLYWEACTGFKCWELLLPEDKNKSENFYFQYSKFQEHLYGFIRKLRSRFKKKSNKKEQIQSEILGNPFNSKIPFFFSTTNPKGIDAKLSGYPKEWYNNVYLLSLFPRLTNKLKKS